MRPSIALAALGTSLLVLVLMFAPVTGCGCSKTVSVYLSNVKFQAFGMVMYAEDNDDRFPQRDEWMDAILPYVKEERTFHDPEFLKTNPSAYGYAFNAALSRAKAPAKPETVPLVYESANPVRNTSDKFTSLPKPGRHGGRNAIGYADGHARMVAP